MLEFSYIERGLSSQIEMLAFQVTLQCYSLNVENICFTIIIITFEPKHISIIFFKDTTTFQGNNLINWGTNPRYKARNPSDLKV